MPITDAKYRRHKIKFLYHLTHVDNMRSILEHGLLSHNEPHAKVLVKKDLSDPEGPAREPSARRPAVA